jgi:hypothetical protein
LGRLLHQQHPRPITALDLAYVGEQWRLGLASRPAPDRLDFQYSLDATSLADGTWTDVDALDFAAPILAGTVGPLNGNLAANRTAMTSTLESLSLPAGATLWVRWVDVDITNSDDGLAIDDFSLAVHGGAGGPPMLEVSDTSADEGDAGNTPLFFTFTLDKPAGADGVVIEYATHDGSASAADDYVAVTSTVTIPAGDTSVIVSIDAIGDTATEADESFSLDVLAVTGADVTDGQGLGTIRNDDFVVSAIHDIQGNGATSPLANQFVTTTGIVTGRKGNGFFLQASDCGGRFRSAELRRRVRLHRRRAVGRRRRGQPRACARHRVRIRAALRSAATAIDRDRRQPIGEPALQWSCPALADPADRGDDRPRPAPSTSWKPWKVCASPAA